MISNTDFDLPRKSKPKKKRLVQKKDKEYDDDSRDDN